MNEARPSSSNASHPVALWLVLLSAGGVGMAGPSMLMAPIAGALIAGSGWVATQVMGPLKI